MNLKMMLFGGYTPPDVPSRVIYQDDGLMRKEAKHLNGLRAAHERNRVRAGETSKRFEAALRAYPWCDRDFLCRYMNLSVGAVKDHLRRLAKVGLIEAKPHPDNYKTRLYRIKE